MLRIYFDWNVISNLKKTEIEKFQKLNSILKKHKNRISSPFSNAHLQDLRKSFRKDEDNSLSYNDLKLLSGLSENHFLEWNTNEKRTLYLRATPEEVFNKNKEYWTGNDIINIENVFDDFITSLDNTEMSDVGKQLKKVLQQTSIGNTQIQQSISNFFETDNISNMWELLNQTSRYMSGMMNDKKAFIKNRNKLKEGGFNLDINHDNWNEKEVFNKLDEALEQSELKMSFSEFLEYSGKFKKANDLFDKFTDAYFQLDMFGYKQDKLKKPNNDMNNILNDSHHCFYAAHCDYFITDDNNLTKKSKAIYSNYGLSTKVLKVSEFIEKESDIFAHQPNDINDILAIQADLYRDENIVEIQEIEGFTHKVFKLPFLLFDYFNYMVVIQRGDNEGFEYYFKRAYNNYSRFIFDTEIETLLNRIKDIFPIDYGEKAVKEFKEIIYKEEKAVILFQDKYYTVYIRKGDYKPELVFYYSEKIRDLSKKDNAN